MILEDTFEQRLLLNRSAKGVLCMCFSGLFALLGSDCGLLFSCDEENLLIRAWKSQLQKPLSPFPITPCFTAKKRKVPLFSLGVRGLCLVTRRDPQCQKASFTNSHRRGFTRRNDQLRISRRIGVNTSRHKCLTHACAMLAYSRLLRNPFKATAWQSMSLRDHGQTP